jgi:homocysteine S-methyltransferase
MAIDKNRGLLAALEQQSLVGDGAMGTQLYYEGYDFERCYEELNLSNPQLIEKILKSYVQAGAEVIETNSFNANGYKLKKFSLDNKVYALNHAAAKIACQAAGNQAFVLGSIGPMRITGEQQHVLTSPSLNECEKLFREQAEGLFAGGVDGFILETFVELSELLTAVKSIRRFSDRPIIAQMAFSNPHRTPDGFSLTSTVTQLSKAGADVVGANCLSGPALYSELIDEFRQQTSLPISSYPNAGYPQNVDGRYIYATSPQYFAKMGLGMLKRGARLVGGCCGTNADHIRQLKEQVLSWRQELGGISIVTKSPTPITVGSDASLNLNLDTPAVENPLLDKLRSPKAYVTVEIEPPRGSSLNRLIEQMQPLIACLEQQQIDAFNISDNPLAKVHMDNLIFVAQLQQHFALPTIVHLTCRDRNLLALQASLLGADALGIAAILALTGDPASIGDQPGAKSVYNTNSIGLVGLVQQLNQGRWGGSAKTRSKSNFAIAVAFNPNSPNLDGELKKLERKIVAGAQFIQTQPIFSEEALELCIQHLTPFGLPILLGLMPLLSHSSAEYIDNEIPGIRVPEAVLKRMAKTDSTDSHDGQVSEGQRIVQELIDHAHGQVSGFYLITPARKFSITANIVKYIRRL